MFKRDNYNHTVYACFAGYIVQAIVNNFAPLLFLTFQSELGVSLDRIAMLVSFNFGVQLVIDLLASRYVDKFGYRPCVYAAHILSAAGLVSLAVLPGLMGDPFAGLLIAVLIYAMGGGLLEVLISPIVEACPADHKEARMSLLHSFYCWGHMGVVLLSTAFFAVFGVAHWRVMAVIWALVPLFNLFFFMAVPIPSLADEPVDGVPMRRLIGMRQFWVLMLLMFCAGSCEQGVSQWASAFAERGLGVSKTIGDLTGPLFFAFTMGSARALYAKFSEKISLDRFMVYSALLCLISYLMASLTNAPALGLLGCGLCGLSVGILWPGTFSIAAKSIRGGGTALFAMLALAGDLGCGGGPALVGFVSDAAGGSLKTGILAGVVFPILLLIGLWLNRGCGAPKSESISARM